MQNTNPTSRVDVVLELVRNLIQEQSEGGRLPSEPELTRLLGVSRATVRQALSQLESERVITRKHGVGTFINHRVLNIGTRLDEVWDFAEMIQLAGYAPGVRHESLQRKTLAQKDSNKKLFSALGLNTGDEVLRTANIFLADNVPVIYCVDVIPARLIQHPYEVEELHGPVYRFLEERCGQRVDYNITEIMAIAADKTMAARLQCGMKAPLHYFEEIGYNANDEPIIYSEEYYAPSFFEFKIVRKLTTRRS